MVYRFRNRLRRPVSQNTRMNAIRRITARKNSQLTTRRNNRRLQSQFGLKRTGSNQQQFRASRMPRILAFQQRKIQLSNQRRPTITNRALTYQPSMTQSNSNMNRTITPQMMQRGLIKNVQRSVLVGRMMKPIAGTTPQAASKRANISQWTRVGVRSVRRGAKIPFNSDSALWRSIGARLTDKLSPNRQQRDLFDKNYRSQIVRNYILKNNGLDNIGTGLKKANDLIGLPTQMHNIFGISIRPMRFENLRARLGLWERYLQLWQGTNGQLLDKDKMVRDGTAVPRLKRGEIGCYDAHYRLWKHIVDNNIPSALILEDDADINYGQSTVDRINEMFREIQENNIQFDLIYLGHNNNKRPKKMVTRSLGTPAGVQGLFMYYLTREGARKLIDGAIPMTQPVDDYAYVSQNRVRQFILEPRLGWVVPIEQSDTANIH